LVFGEEESLLDGEARKSKLGQFPRSMPLHESQPGLLGQLLGLLDPDTTRQ